MLLSLSFREKKLFYKVNPRAESDRIFSRWKPHQPLHPSSPQDPEKENELKLKESKIGFINKKVIVN